MPLTFILNTLKIYTLFNCLTERKKEREREREDNKNTLTLTFSFQKPLYESFTQRKYDSIQIRNKPKFTYILTQQETIVEKDICLKTCIFF